MREVIQKVIATEAEAKHLVEAARAEAGRIIAEAQRQAEALISQARQDARVEGERILTATVDEAGRERQEQVTRATQEMESELRFDEDTRERAIQAVVRCVCGEH
jgi:V/A-type H+-transporting ATPase subunit G/H